MHARAHARLRSKPAFARIGASFNSKAGPYHAFKYREPGRRLTESVARSGNASGDPMDTRDERSAWSARAGTAPLLADSAPVEARAAFLTRTYLHLLGAIGAFTLLEALWFSTPVASAIFHALSAGRFVQLAMFAAFIGVGYLADRWARSSPSTPMQYAGLGLFVFAESILFLPLIGIALMLGAQGEPGILS